MSCMFGKNIHVSRYAHITNLTTQKLIKRASLYSVD